MYTYHFSFLQITFAAAVYIFPNNSISGNAVLMYAPILPVFATYFVMSVHIHGLTTLMYL